MNQQQAPLGIDPKLWSEIQLKPNECISCMFRLDKNFLESAKFPVSNDPPQSNRRAQVFEQECLQLFQRLNIPITDIVQIQFAANIHTCMIRMPGKYVRQLVLNPLVLNAKRTSH